MIIRSIWDSFRSATFSRKRLAIHRRAIASKDGILKAVGDGLLLRDIQQYDAHGANGDYTVFVTLPSAPPPRAAGYPVLYLLDGNAWAAGVTEALRFQSRFSRQSEIEPLIIVAVGYPGDAPIDLGRRAFDFLPKHSSGKLSARFMQGAPWHQPGGAGPFLDFLTGPLRNDIAERYPVDLSRQVLCGHSFGGFFTLHALLTRPRAFWRYAALSPSLWWDDECLMRTADEMIAALPPDLSTRLFIAVGGDEAPDRPEVSMFMKTSTRELAAKLKAQAPSGLDVTYRVLEGENHLSVPMVAFSSVLRFIAEQQAAAPAMTEPAESIAARRTGR